MAIIRERIPLPGKLGKIFDIRLGLPRDRGFDPVKEAKRYHQDSQPNENTRINKMRSFLSQAEGLARPNRFIAVVNIPQALQTAVESSQEFVEYTTQQEMTSSLNNLIRDRLIWFCDSASLPGRNITDETKDMLYGPERKIARGVGFEDLTLTFYMGQTMAEKALFESWQNLAINPNTHNANFYDEYCGSIQLYPLIGVKNNKWEDYESPQSKKWSLTGMIKDKVFGNKPVVAKRKVSTGDDRAMAIATVGAYYNHLTEAWPTAISAVPLSYNTNNEIMKLTVTFTYRKAIGPADVEGGLGVDSLPQGKLRPGEVSIGEYQKRGQFGGIIEQAKKIGRDVLNQAKVRFPWGRIFGGKVIPPFF